MLKPDIKSVKELAENYNTVPVSKEFYADVVTPITLLRRIAGISDRFFLLESVEGGEKWGRYSFLGFDPIMRVTCKDKTVKIEKNGETETITTAKPLDVVRKILSKYKAPDVSETAPFTGGFVGYFAYSMIGYAEPKLKISGGDFNDMDLMLFEKVIAYDHLKQKISISVNIRTDKAEENYSKAEAIINETAKLIHSERPLPQLPVPKVSEFSCNFSKEEYCEVVERTKEYIRDGDIFQAVISRRFEADYEGSLINAYRVLRTTNPSPYMVYMSIDGDEIMSTSPETLVRLQNGRLYTFPVAGSRPRGKTDEEDIALEKGLLADEKELSEHNMLVDLGRNDLGRISKFGSVEVTKYKVIHRYSKIMHICSQVESNIRDDCDAMNAIESVLPAGTLSGAPKIRACEIIEELEKCPRNIYGGALGYMDFSGNLDTCIAIRMAFKKNGKVYVQAGGGIVADSVPESEYMESHNKALAVINAIKTCTDIE
ncbi:MAG: anthranilate synthase component I family protein [Clostridia bacterium]|nr:anthranilate synthase component I family protein [Clostridia bacterium]